MRRLAITLLATALVLAACSGGDDAADESSSTAPTTASGGTSPSTVAAREALDVPPEVTAAEAEWPLPGRDYANSRARDDSAITRANVDALDVAWSVPLPGSAAFGNAATTPVIVDVTGTFQGQIVVVDRGTGDVVRTFDAPGGINGWPAATRDTIVWPVGLADPPSLVAYRVPSG